MQYSILTLVALLSIALAAPVTNSPRAVSVDLGGAGLDLRDSEPATRAVSVDLGGAGLDLRDLEPAVRAVSVDLGGAGLDLRQTPDLGVVELLENLCSNLGGVKVTETVCRTATGTDVSVAAATEEGLATITLSGDGLLSGASITVPVATADSVLRQIL